MPETTHGYFIQALNSLVSQRTMLLNDLQERIIDTFQSEFSQPRRNVYLVEYYSSRSLNQEILSSVFADLSFEDNDIAIEQSEAFEGDLEQDYWTVTIKNEEMDEDGLILFTEVRQDTWLVIFSSVLNRKLLRKLRNLENEFTWIIDSWVKGEEIERLYEQYSPGQESVDIERRWDPYWVYQQSSHIPDDMADYFNSHIDEFVEQEIELNVKTPQRLIGNTLKKGIRKELLEKSELSESSFKVEPPQDILLQDGGAFAEPSADQTSSRVTVNQNGEFIHNSGDPEATLFSYQEGASDQDLREEFLDLYPERSYTETSGDVIKLDGYKAGKTLKLTFVEKEFNEEISIKLLNLFTYGHNDVETHGAIIREEEKKFQVETYTSYDRGEYIVEFGPDENGCPSLSITPRSGQPEGLIHIYRKLREKIDPRVERTILDPNTRAA